MIQSKLGELKVGSREPVRIMGVINLSPESFYQASVKTQADHVIKQAKQMVSNGADIIDLGGMSTAPYKDTHVTTEEELERVKPIIDVLYEEIDAEISVDTQRSKVAEEALKSGASIINDVWGFKQDEEMAKIVEEYEASAIIMARKKEKNTKSLHDPFLVVRNALRESLELAAENNINRNKLIIDPGIGFWRNFEGKWIDWDTLLVRELKRLSTLELPICVGVSRKSFIGDILGQEEPSERLIGSVATESIAVMNGADIIRTHNVSETKQAVQMAEKIIEKKKSKLIETGNVTARELPKLEKNDIEELLRDKIGVHPGGVRIMGVKGVFKNILLENIPETLALVLKQEALARGAEVALPKEAILGRKKEVDLLLMGTIQQLKGVKEKLELMEFSYLEEKGFNAPDLAEMISQFLP